ncbi:hypothetical protein QVN60_03375 [Yersinia aleksiciae]|uniref:hypothetical protein n=1 Tax=Yersinia aleksiciae TaxID=263819 RepID=UPI0025AAF853|nr:hypothetical protein [Yersinia aleksiciae]MDN0122256.1 hypothetical protein [Yersinia aleksiciae]
MKFQPAKLYSALLISCVSFTVLAITHSDDTRVTSRSELQMGFYDLLSHKKEIYDVRVTAMNDTVISTITNPNDNRFIFKGKFTIEPAQNQQINYKYTPIFYNNPTSSKMIDGFMDYMTHNDIYMTPMIVGGQPLLYGLSGIFLDDTRQIKESEKGN